MRDGLMDHVDALSSKINFAFGGEGKNSKLYHSKHLANLGPSAPLAFGLTRVCTDEREMEIQEIPRFESSNVDAQIGSFFLGGHRKPSNDAKWQVKLVHPYHASQTCKSRNV